MALIRLRLLGALAVYEGDLARPLPVDLRSALVGLLASHDAPVPRERVAAVFWPDAPETSARRNLRRLLHRVRELVGGEAILGDGTTVELRCDHDLQTLRAAHEAGDAITVAGLASNQLLDGLELVPNEEWRAWLEFERRHLYESARRLVLAAASRWADEGPPQRALACLAAWVDRDPFDEDVLAAYLRCARHVPSESAAASARLARVATVIEQEIGSGLPEGLVFASAWLGERGGASSAPTQVPEPWGVHSARHLRHGLSDLPLFGRERELAMLDEFLADESVRLVTVHGPGGIGKTRLLRAWAAARREGSSALPVVSLADARDEADAVRRVAIAHGWQVGDEAAPDRLGERLAHGSRELLLDEVEGKDWLPGLVERLLRAAPLLRVVVTSRDRLDVPGEQLLRLTGLALPDAGELTWDAPALRLFAAAARRVRPDITLGDADLAAAARFARSADGSPMALTVAAGWLQLGPPANLLDGLLSDGDALGLDEVMRRSWERLVPAERATLEALSVFPARFSLEAALAIAACDRSTLRRLVDASLIQPGTVEGFVLHALVRHHAASRLARDTDASERARERHAEHLRAILTPRLHAIWGGAEQQETFTFLLARLPDLQQAWTFACQRSNVEWLDALLDAVWCLEMRCWYELGAELTEQAVRSLEAAAALDPERAELALARALARRGIFAQRLGDARTTRITAERALAIFERRGLRVDPFVYFHLGIAALFDGDDDGFESWHLRLLEEAEAAGDAWAAAGAHGNLAIAYRDRGHLQRSERHARRGLERMSALQDAWGTALANHTLAETISSEPGREGEALELLARARTYAASLGNEYSLVECTVLTADLQLRLGSFSDAEAAYSEALMLLDAGALSGMRSPERGGTDAAYFRHKVHMGLERARAVAPRARSHPPRAPGG